jgi:geranylgeranyl pyrophosphate synthase
MKQALQQVQQHLDSQLRLALSDLKIADPRLAESMEYGLLNGGKRLRPFLAYATTKALGGDQAQADTVAVALEMVHSYSLVHDDLPAMDDDDLRRGKPTTHIQFDEATAILAGDALLTAAFERLADEDLYRPEQKVALIQTLAKSAGASGMVAGQSIDMNHVGKQISLVELETMHRHKTGALIRASVTMGAMAALYPLPAQIHQALAAYSDAIGLAFQVQDDILDIESDTETLGKPQGADQALNKPTYPALLGLEGAKQKAQQLCHTAVSALAAIPGDTSTLSNLAHYIVERDH